MRIARICYAGYNSGSSKRNFEQEILKAVLNGCDLGDINHSDQFPRTFRPFVRREIRNRTKEFLNSSLEQTGFEIRNTIYLRFQIYRIIVQIPNFNLNFHSKGHWWGANYSHFYHLLIHNFNLKSKCSNLAYDRSVKFPDNYNKDNFLHLN